MSKDWKFARYHKGGYEVSTHGDKRFSALVARMPDGRTIEQHYQLDVKGYKEITDNWMFAKGKPPLRKIHPDDLWLEYLNLWRCWAKNNPFFMQDLAVKAKGKVLTDLFASTPISKARALATLLNEMDL